MALFQYHLRGVLQYKTQAEGDACNVWLTDWVAAHQSEITSGSHGLTNTLDPPDINSEGCVVQLNFDYAFDTDVDRAVYYQTVGEQIAWGGLGLMDCNSDY